MISLVANQWIDVFLLYLFTMEELFDLTLKRYGIQAKALAEITGVSQNHISEFRRGKLKTGVTTDCLLKLLVGMDELAPGSRRYFCDLLGGKKFPQGFEGELEFLIDAAGEEELETAMLQIVRRMFPKDLNTSNKDNLGISNNEKTSRDRLRSAIPV